MQLVPLSDNLRTKLQSCIDTYGETAVSRALFTSPATLTKIRLGGSVRPATLSSFIDALTTLEARLRAALPPIETVSSEQLAELAIIAETEGKGRLARALGISPITLNRLLQGKGDPATVRHAIAALPTLLLEPRKKSGRPKKRFDPYQ